MLRHTFASIDLAAYRNNVRAARRMAGPGVKLLAVVKADAYGHGAVPVAKAAEAAGADWLGVAIAEEGIDLRAAGITLPILIFGPVNAEGARAAAENRLTMAVFTPSHILATRNAAEAAGRPVDVHIKIDTGMNRVGVRTEEELRLVLDAISQSKALSLTGAFTHFADGGNPDTAFTDDQLFRFKRMLSLLPLHLLVHASASTMLPRREARFNMARPGIALYGYPPVPYSEGMLPVLSWEAEITHVKEIAPGEAVGYGVTYHAHSPRKIATLAVGYGDGYSRGLSNRGQVLAGGRRCPIVGRVCMDQMMVDVTEVPQVRPGDSAVLIGRQGEGSILADELAGLLGTIPYEVLLAISQRVPRVYKG